jgi:hypothetical protein
VPTGHQGGLGAKAQARERKYKLRALISTSRENNSQETFITGSLDLLKRHSG